MVTAVSIMGGMTDPVSAAVQEDSSVQKNAVIQDEESAFEEEAAAENTAVQVDPMQQKETDSGTAEEESGSGIGEDVSQPKAVPESGEDETAEDSSRSGEEEEFQEETGSGRRKSPEWTAADAAAAEDPSVMCEEMDSDTGVFTIRIRNAKLSSGEQLLAAVWQDAGQKDLIWTAAREQDGEYLLQESAGAHGGRSGTYQIHVYKRSRSGTMIFLAGTSCEIRPSAETLSADRSGSKVRTVLSGVRSFGTVSGIKLAVWSEAGGQDDLVWYTASKQSDGEWKASVSLEKHRGTGTLYVHAYAFTKTGQAVFLKKTELMVKKPSAGSIQASTPNSKTGEFAVKISEIDAPQGISVIQVPVWSRPDQSDIVWYTAAEQSDGSWVAKGNLKKHKNHKELFQIHVYLTDQTGVRSFLTKTTMSGAALRYGSLTAAVDEEGKEAAISLSGLQKGSAAGNVRFAVWSEENGQDDLKWYAASSSETDYTAAVPLANHHSKGDFQLHAYLWDAKAGYTFIGKTSFQVSALKISQVAVTELDHQQGSFRITVSPADEKNLSCIQAAVWSTDDQSNIKWYRIRKSGDGTWWVKINIENHQNRYGTYQIHAYGEMKDGTMKFLAASTAELKEENKVVLERMSQDSVKITVYGPAWKGKAASSVTFPTWSEENGQDDLVWYTGRRQADGSYQAEIRLAKHKHAGEFITHVYVSDGSSQGVIKGLSYRMSSNSQEELDEGAIQVMRNIIYAVETGGQVYGGHTYDSFSEAYANSSAETAITIGAGAWFANEAKTLLNRIRTEYPSVFAANDTAGIAEDLDSENWKYYGTDGAGNKTIRKGSEKAQAIQKIIGTKEGIAVQDALVDEQMVKYADQAGALGVTDLKARLFCANIQHLGGYSAMVRVINYCKNDGEALTMENLWTNMREREAGSGNKVGSDLYASRHTKVMQWLNKYL